SVGATVNFYGIHPNVKPDYSKLSGPVLGLFAEKDGFVTPQVAKETDAAIKKAGKQSEIHVYPNVDHGFFNDERPDVYNKAAAEDAWRRTLAFFRQHLKYTPPPGLDLRGAMLALGGTCVAWRAAPCARNVRIEIARRSTSWIGCSTRASSSKLAAGSRR